MRLVWMMVMPQNNAALNQVSHYTLPLWQGLLFLAGGLAILLLSPWIVALTVSSSDSVYQWMLKRSGLEKMPLFLRKGSSTMGAYTKIWHWFGILLLGGACVVLGVAAILKQPFGP